MQKRRSGPPLKRFSSTTTTTDSKAGPLATFPVSHIILFAGASDRVTNRTELIRGCTNGNIRIDTRDGQYWLSTAEVSDLLFFGRKVLLRQDGGIIDGEAIAYLHQGGKRIIIALYKRAYCIPRSAFIVVATGELSPTPMTAIPWT